MSKHNNPQQPQPNPGGGGGKKRGWRLPENEALVGLLVFLFVSLLWGTLNIDTIQKVWNERVPTQTPGPTPINPLTVVKVDFVPAECDPGHFACTEPYYEIVLYSGEVITTSAQLGQWLKAGELWQTTP